MAQSAQKGGKGGVGDAASEVAPVGANGLQGIDHGNHQLREIMRLAIRESLLGQLPDALVGVELRRIGREALQMQPRGARAQLTDELATMGIAAVPQDDDVPADLPEQLSQEVAGLQLSDVLRVELKVHVEALAAGRHRNPRDDGEPVASIDVVHRGRLADGSPGGGDRGGQLALCVDSRPLLRAFVDSSTTGRAARTMRGFLQLWWEQMVSRASTIENHSREISAH